MIGTVDIKVNAAHPNMPLSALYTFLGSPQQVRVINVPKAIGNWKITAVQVTVNYPDNSSPSVEATLTGGCWHGTLPAPSATGKSLMGFKITASGVDEHGDPITGYVLGKGDAYVLDDDATITVGGTTYYVHMLDAVPESPRKGDLAVIDNIYQLYDGSRWHPLGNQATISWSDITGKPTTFPPSAHDHTNDSWFTTAIEAVKTWASGAFAALSHSHAGDSWFTSALAGKVPWANAAHNAVTIGSRQSGSVIGSGSLAQGSEVNATGDSTHAEGVLAHSEGVGTHAEGTYTYADGRYTHAEGYGTQAVGVGTHAEGAYTHTDGLYTHAEGGFTTAGKSDGNRGRYAHAAGFNAQATNATAFTWNGSAKDNPSTDSTSPDYVPPYGDHGNGTYNLNPAGGLSGFWIGQQNLANLFNAKVGSFAAVGGVTPTVSEGVANVSALFTIDNTANNLDNIRTSAADATTAKNYIGGLIRYSHATYTSGKLTDRAVNAFTMTGNVTVQFPDAVTGKARDFLLLVTHTSGELTLPTGNTYYGDAPTMDAGATYLIALTEVSAGVWYMRTIKMEVPNG